MEKNESRKRNEADELKKRIREQDELIKNLNKGSPSPKRTYAVVEDADSESELEDDIKDKRKNGGLYDKWHTNDYR